MVSSTTISTQQVWEALTHVTDPEIPVLSIIDLGIVRNVTVNDKEALITITPTYTGCPAMDVIGATIKMELLALGFDTVNVNQVLSPAWTTDWMSEDGKAKLKAYGIAPPNHKQQVCSLELFAPHEAVQCPHCNAYHTHRISEFGSTACKALYQCDECKEVFDYFKCY